MLLFLRYNIDIYSPIQQTAINCQIARRVVRVLARLGFFEFFNPRDRLSRHENQPISLATELQFILDEIDLFSELFKLIFYILNKHENLQIIIIQTELKLNLYHGQSSLEGFHVE